MNTTPSTALAPLGVVHETRASRRLAAEAAEADARAQARTNRQAHRRPVAVLLAALLAVFAGLFTAPVASAADNDQIAFNFFVSKGLTKAQAAGIVGNLNQESGIPMRPTAVQSGGAGRGIAQWSVGGRWDTDPTNLVKYANSKGWDRWSLNTQLNFIWHELTTNSTWGLSRLRGTTNIHDATVAFMQTYERCGDCMTAQRVSYATSAYNKFSGSTTTETALPTLRQGNTGASVRSLQYLLRGTGRSLAVDGSFGPGTLTAVKSFQGSKGLSADGVVGIKTWGALLPKLSQGSTGDGVRALQQELRDAGYTSVAVDGSFGPATNTAVRSYQSANKLTVDGIVGHDTWGSLLD